MDLSKFNLPSTSNLLSGLVPQISSGISESFKNTNMQMRDGFMTQVDEITSIEFLDKWYISGENFHLGKAESITRVIGNIKIDLKRIPKKYGILENFEFEHSVIFMGENDENLTLIGECIVFLNCKFEKKLFLKNCKFERGITPHNSFEANSIEICGGLIKEIVIENCELRGLLFSKSDSEALKIGLVDIKNCEFLNGSISFNNTEVNEMCDINFNNFNHGSLRLVNNKILCGCRLSVNKNLSLHFYGRESVFEKPVFIYHGSYRSIDFSDIRFHDEVDLIACSIEEEIKLIGNTFEDRLWILSKDETDNSICNVTPNEVWIQNNRFENGFKYNPEKNLVNRLIAVFSEKSSGVMEFQNGVFNKVEILGSNFNNSLFFRDCLYSYLDISNFFNKALISFNSNFPNNTLAEFEEIRIENSNLGNIEFYDFDFSIYQVVRIIDSRLDNIFANGVEWFRPDQLQVDDSETDLKKILSQKREIYRQLKLAAEKQSDRITALEFKAKEVETHRLTLELGKVKKADRLAILAGKTNDHGQNWVKPLWVIILISFGFFFPLLFIADPEIHFWPDFSLDGLKLLGGKFSEHSKIIPQLFNPTRRVSDMFKVIEHPFWVYLLDGLQRIILAFFIFQIVSAFRKFVK
jgi:hypothetical protein